jgi:hypothetical protein
MTLEYAQAVEVKRRPWQRRIEVSSLKLRRRLTLFSRGAQDAWILLEADPRVHSFCERPAYIEGNAGRVLDFWVDEGRHQHFWVVSPTDAERSSIAKTNCFLRYCLLTATDRLLMIVRRQVADLWRRAATGATATQSDWALLYQELLAALGAIVADPPAGEGGAVRCLFRGPYDVLHLHVPNDLIAECARDMTGHPAPVLCSKGVRFYCQPYCQRRGDEGNAGDHNLL